MVMELVFSLEMDPEKPVESLPLTYLRCCHLSLGKTQQKALHLTPVHFPAPLYNKSARSLQPSSPLYLLLVSLEHHLSPHTHLHCHHQLLCFEYNGQFSDFFLIDPWQWSGPSWKLLP